MTEKTAEIILSFLDRYNRHFEDLAFFLSEKQNRILVDDLKWLEEALAREQAYIMQGNSLEEKRLELFKQSGLEGKKLEELPQYFPEGYEGALRLQKDRLNKSIAKIRQLTQTSNDLVERKLEVQAKLLGVSDFTGIGAYSDSAKIVKGTGGSGDVIGSV